MTIRAHDLAWVEDYSAHVPALIGKHGGAYFAVSETVKRYEGEGPDLDSIVILSFPSMAAADAFVSDPDYQPFTTARLAATSGDMSAFTPRG